MKRNARFDFFFFVIVAALSLVRVQYGFDATDEPYFVALIDWMRNGARPFADIWAMHLTSALPLVPVAWMWHAIVGSSDGILLCFRIVTVVIQFITAVIVWRILSSATGVRRWQALAIPLMCQVLAPLSIQTINYNTQSLVLGELILSIALVRPTRTYAQVIQGSLMALLVQVYPSSLIAVGYVAIVMIVQAGETNDRRKLFINLAAGSMTVLGLFFVLVGLLGTSPRAVFMYLPNVLGVNRAGNASSFQGMPGLINLYWVIAGQFGTAMLIASVVVSLVSCRAEDEKKAQYLRTVSDAFALVFLVIWIEGVFSRFVSRPLINYCAGPILVGCALATVPTFIRVRVSRFTSIVFASFSLIQFVATQLMTDQGFQISGYQLIFAIMGFMLLDTHTYRGSLKTNSLRYPMSTMAARVLLIAIIVISTVSVYGTRFFGHYREEPVTELHTRIEGGPAQGLISTEDTCVAYNEVYSTVQAWTNADTALAVEVYYPTAFLMTEAKPVGFTPGRVRISSGKLDTWYKVHPNTRPDVILLFRDEYAQYQWEDPTDRGGYLGELMESGSYEVFNERPCTVYADLDA